MKINIYRLVLGEGPKGSTDSETAFYYFLGHLRELTGTTNSDNISIDQIKTAFSQAIYDLITESSLKTKELNYILMKSKSSNSTWKHHNFV